MTEFLNPKTERVLKNTRYLITILNFVGLGRVKKGVSGHYIIERPIIKPLLIIIFSVFVVVYYIWHKHVEQAEESSTITLLHLTHNIVMIIAMIHIIVSVLAAALEKSKYIRKYYENMQTIDDILDITNTDYKEDKKGFLLIYLAVSLCLILNTIEFIMWVHVDDFFLRDWYYLGLRYLRLMLELNMVNYTTRLILLKNRTKKFENLIAEEANKIIEFGERKIFRIQVRAKKIMADDLRKCYFLLFDQSCLINDRFGFQLVFYYMRIVFFAIHVTYSIITITVRPQALLSHQQLHVNEKSISIPVVMDLLTVLQAIFIVIISLENVMAIVRSNRNTLPFMEKCAADYFLSEEQRIPWKRLVALCRRHPLEFSANGFFKLDYSLLASMFGTMVTYIVVLAQIKDDNMKLSTISPSQN